MSFRIAEKPVHGLDHDLDQINILPLVEASDIISLSYLSFMEYKVYRTGMVLNEKPVTHILTPSIHRKRLAVSYIIDKQRYKLLRKLIRTIIVRAIGHNHRHAVCIMEGSDEMVGTCLAGTVGTMRIVFRGLIEEIITIRLMTLGRSYCLERRLNSFRMVHGQGTVDLICGYMIETALNIRFLVSLRSLEMTVLTDPVAGWLPAQTGSLQKRKGSKNICAGECERILDRPIHMRLGSKMDDSVHLFLLHE